MSRRLIVEDLVQLYYPYLYASPKDVYLQTELQISSSGGVYTTCSITKHMDPQIDTTKRLDLLVLVPPISLPHQSQK